MSSNYRNVDGAMKITHLLLFVSLSLSAHTITWLFLSWRQWGARGGMEQSQRHWRNLVWTVKRATGAALFQIEFVFSAVSRVDSRFVWIIEVWWQGLLLGKAEKENSLKPIGVYSVNTTVKETHSENLRCSNFIWGKWWLWGLLGYILIFWFLK